MLKVLRRYRAYRDGHRWVRWAEDGFILLTLIAAVTAWQTRNLVPSGEVAPVFALQDLEGKSWSSNELLGKKVVLHFWAPWCSVCKADVGAISSLAKSAGDDAVVVSVAGSYEDLADVKKFVQEQGVDYPVLLGNDALLRAFKVNAFPTTYFVSKEGKIRHAAVGYTTGVGLRWRLWF